MIKVLFPLDETFTSFHPEAHLPLSLVQGKPVYAEVSLLDPTEPGLVLLVHSCLAYTQTPYPSWMFIYDGCVPKYKHHHNSGPFRAAPCVTKIEPSLTPSAVPVGAQLSCFHPHIPSTFGGLSSSTSCPCPQKATPLLTKEVFTQRTQR